MPRSVLVIFAHPAFERSRVNRVLARAARGVEGVTFSDLYERYPDFDVDVRAEQAALLAHDTFVFHHPFYWYSVPPLLKQWMDLVLQHGWAYGRGGTRLHGKRALHVLTAGGPELAYRPDGTNRYTMAELLRPLEQTARLCGLEWLPPFVAHGTHRMEPPEMEAHAADYRRLLVALRDDAVDAERARVLARINADLDAVLAARGPAPTAETGGAAGPAEGAR